MPLAGRHRDQQPQQDLRPPQARSARPAQHPVVFAEARLVGHAKGPQHPGHGAGPRHRIAPVTSTRTCSHTGHVNSGAKEPKTINATSGSISTVCRLASHHHQPAILLRERLPASMKKAKVE